MFDNILNFFKKFKKEDKKDSKDTAKERLHLVLMQDRANVSADFLELMKQEIIEVIKKYIDVDENAIDVRLTNKSNDDGTGTYEQTKEIRVVVKQAVAAVTNEDIPYTGSEDIIMVIGIIMVAMAVVYIKLEVLNKDMKK